jgi:2-dehydropantoate 2-reductase
VWACVRQPFEELVVEGPAPLRAKPRVLVDPADAETCAFVVLATKAYDVEGAAPWLRRLVGAGSVVAVLQNGVEHEERVRPYVGDARVLPVVVQCPATLVAPGHVAQREPAMFLVPATAEGEAFAALFDGAPTKVETVSDFTTAVWRKLCFNTVSGGLTTLHRVGMGVTRQPDVAARARVLMNECMAVARAEGARLGAGDAADLLAYMQAQGDDVATSMLTDRLAGRRLEIDARNRVIVRLGERHGVATPENEELTRELEEIGPQ